MDFYLLIKLGSSLKIIEHSGIIISFFLLNPSNITEKIPVITATAIKSHNQYVELKVRSIFILLGPYIINKNNSTIKNVNAIADIIIESVIFSGANANIIFPIIERIIPNPKITHKIQGRLEFKIA